MGSTSDLPAYLLCLYDCACMRERERRRERGGNDDVETQVRCIQPNAEAVTAPDEHAQALRRGPARASSSSSAAAAAAVAQQRARTLRSADPGGRWPLRGMSPGATTGVHPR